MASPSRRISRQDVQSIYPLLGIQKGMLFHDLSSPEHQPYFRQVSFRIEGRLDARLCERTWNELMARHESLRSCFDYENTSQLLRLVWNQRTVEFDCCDLSRADEPARIAALNEYRGLDRKRGFDLRRDPLMRVKLFQLGGSRCEMVWSWPHIILDGWSGSVLLDEFARIYSDFAAGRAPSLPPAPDHREYMDWLASRDAGAARDYWAGLLDGYETLATIPKPSAALDQCGYDPAEHAFELSHSQAAALRELAARNGVTQSTVLHCLWGILLGRYNDTDDVVFGAVVSGRPPEVAGMERMVGLFLNTIPVRVRAEPSAAFAALLQDVQRSAIESMRHDHLPLAEIQAVSSMKRGLFDHVLAFENYPRSVPAAGAEFAASSVETYEHSNYDFGVLILPGTPFRILFKYNRSAYSSARMERLEVHLRTLVGQVLRNDRVLLGDLNILAPSERTVLAGPPAPYHPDSTLAGLWDARVAASPESTALILDQRGWPLACSWFVRIASATNAASASEVLGSIIPNSSPPYLAAVSIWRINYDVRSLTSFMTKSPARWPRLSFIFLKLSTSTIIQRNLLSHNALTATVLAPKSSSNVLWLINPVSPSVRAWCWIRSNIAILPTDAETNWPTSSTKSNLVVGDGYVHLLVQLHYALTHLQWLPPEFHRTR